jgi:putative membrane protein
MTLASAIAASGLLLAMAIPRQPPQGDIDFSRNAAANALFEIQLGQIVMDWSPSDQVRRFGERMRADYTDFNEQLQRIAAKNHFTLPDAPGPKNQATIDMLTEIPQRPRPLYEPAFDQVYIEEMIKCQKTDIAAFEKERAEGSSDDVKNWAAAGLPVLREHLQLAKNADDYLGSVSQILRKK